VFCFRGCSSSVIDLTTEDDRDIVEISEEVVDDEEEAVVRSFFSLSLKFLIFCISYWYIFEYVSDHERGVALLS